jgi:tRNA (guanosine-2'-O-)-methyltransferase
MFGHPEKHKLIAYLEGFVNEQRQHRLKQVLSERSAHMRIVLENIFQAHNASAVLRSCDCFGVQHVHFIENRNPLKISEDVALGSSKWLSIHRHNERELNTVHALRQLKQQGYRIVATSPHKNDVNVTDLPVDKKFALVFGTEIEGISKEVIEEADEFVKIPMYGFTESFNISVSAAICMYELSNRIRKTVKNYGLSEEEKTDLYLDWLTHSAQQGEWLVKDYLSRHK